MKIIFEIIDKTGREVYLSKERWKHILKHPNMHNQIESIKVTLEKPLAVRYYEEDEKVEECAECGAAIKEGKKVAREIEGDEYAFCSDACAKEFEESIKTE